METSTHNKSLKYASLRSAAPRRVKQALLRMIYRITTRVIVCLCLSNLVACQTVSNPKPSHVEGVWEKVDSFGYGYLRMDGNADGVLVMIHPGLGDDLEFGPEVSIFDSFVSEENGFSIRWVIEGEEPLIVKGVLYNELLCLGEFDPDGIEELCFLKRSDLDMFRSKAIQAIENRNNKTRNEMDASNVVPIR